MAENNLEIWKFPDPVTKVKIKINNHIIIGFTGKRPTKDVFDFAMSESTGK
jgi:hypothetical protein